MNAFRQTANGTYRKAYYKYVMGLFFLLVLAGCSFKPRIIEQDPYSRFDISYRDKVQKVFDNRCVACHGCYDSPCQLNLTTYEGVVRGASKLDAYEVRLVASEPYRLGIDAQSVSQWRERGFFPVVTHSIEEPEKNLEHSFLYKLIQYRKNNPLPKIEFNSDKSRKCLDSSSEFDKLEAKALSALMLTSYKDLGMPYGFPALSDEDFNTIKNWISKGSFAPPEESPLPKKLGKQVRIWEQFLNGNTAKEKLVGRYLYEHWFLGHLYFLEEGKTRPTFFRLVRSSTAEPEPIKEIATALPYGDPKGLPVYYRFKRINQTIVRKTHIVYQLSNSKMARVKKLFYDDSWNITDSELPKYSNKQASNPFVTFEKIPAKARYQFLLDNAEYFVMNFIRGPVCRGQTALDVINDHFWILFLNPNSDVSVKDPRLLKQSEPHLALPYVDRSLLEGFEQFGPFEILAVIPNLYRKIYANFYPRFKSRQLSYLAVRNSFYEKAFPQGFSLSDIWNGEGVNENSVLTVYRHFDNAEVTAGAVGEIPKTVLVLDYPIFERMYYNLVVNFDLFGDVGHQLATRLYFNNLRIEGEDLFLSFLPLKDRVAIRNSWYIRAEDEMTNKDHPLYGTTLGKKIDTQISFSSKESKKELLSLVLDKHFTKKVRGERDHINLHNGQMSPIMGSYKTVADFERGLRNVTSTPKSFVRVFPDSALLRLVVDESDESKDVAYTIIHNREHFNVMSVFREEKQLNPDANTLHFLKGYYASYPNFFFSVTLSQAHRFLYELSALGHEKSEFQEFVNRYGIRRTDEKRFWPTYDWFMKHYFESDPVQAGVLDLNRYANY